MDHENEFDNEITKTWKFPVLDGITDIKMYKKAKPRILWILKEANKSTPKEQWNHRNFHKEVNNYKLWRQTYQKIIYVSFGMIYDTGKYSDLPCIDSEALIDGINVLEMIAIINVNKSGGGSRSSDKQISESYKMNRESILKQIELIGPEIIINASRVWSLYDDLIGNSQRKKYKDNEYAINGDRLIINAYHPNARYSEEKYYNSIFKIFYENY